MADAGARVSDTQEAPADGGAATAGPVRRHSALVAGGILLSRLSGLAREKLIGFFLGAGGEVDAFRAALRIPNLLQNLLGEGVLSASFIPVYSRLLDEGREEEAGRVAGAIAGLLALLAGTLVVVGVVFARPVTSVIAAGLPLGDKLDLTVTLVRIITPGIGFLVLSAWCLGVLNSHRRFFLSYVAPVLWNAAMIAVLVAFGFRLSQQDLVVALAWGTFVGAALQLAVQLPGVLRVSRGLRPSLDTARPGVRRVVRAFGPVVAGRGVVQLSAYLDVTIASFLATGALAVLGFAQTLYMLPISLFGMSVAAAELPELSAMDHADRSAVTRRLDAGLARIAFFVVPSAVVFLVLGDDVVGVLYQGGEFTRSITLQVWAVLAAYTLGLLASTATRLLQSALYGAGDTRRPALVAAVRVALSAVLGVVLMLQFEQLRIAPTGGVEQVGAIPTFAAPPEALRDAADNQLRLGAVGLALGASVGAWIEYLLLRRAVRRRFGPVRLGGGQLGRIGAAALAAGAVALAARWLAPDLSPWAAAPITVGATGLAYLGAAAALGIGEVTDVVASVRSRLRG